jgi:putative serine/threonine protein kinase
MKFSAFKRELKILGIAGKGWRGTVYRAHWKGKEVAVKVARSEDKIKAIKKEAGLLKELKGKRGFPQILHEGEDFFIYDFIEGKPFKKTSLGRKGRKEVLLRVLELARELDTLGIRHGELNEIGGNVLIGNNMEVYLIDFDRGSRSKRPSNVPQALQNLIREGFIPLEEAKELGRRYLSEPDKVFSEIAAKLK